MIIAIALDNTMSTAPINTAKSSVDTITTPVETIDYLKKELRKI